MDITIAPGRYVVAVSGGVDSMVLLDILRQNPDLELLVAHFDHGIRTDSSKDRQLVQKKANEHGLKFVYDEGNLGLDASEAKARDARYDFLYKVRSASRSSRIVTAHHQDDLIETVIINIIRGTGHRGLSSMRSNGMIYRPLIEFNKEELVSYAYKNNIKWSEDPTNQDTKYLRNYIRHNIIPNLSSDDKKRLLENINNAQKLRSEIEEHLTSLLHRQTSLNMINRHWFIMLPYNVANEVMAEWLKRNSIKNVNRKLVENLVNIARVSQPNRVADIDKQSILEVKRDYIKITPRYR
ncbi:tRNA lysidine(34) synthetase TilS [Candidatus Saccharibacteria bacterium]|nr:tRNA lysidine(34) synthetase TilS [Candidatus Saccharibacteria bacterium]